MGAAFWWLSNALTAIGIQKDCKFSYLFEQISRKLSFQLLRYFFFFFNVNKRFHLQLLDHNQPNIKKYASWHFSSFLSLEEKNFPNVGKSEILFCSTIWFQLSLQLLIQWIHMTKNVNQVTLQIFPGRCFSFLFFLKSRSFLTLPSVLIQLHFFLSKN